MKLGTDIVELGYFYIPAWGKPRPEGVTIIFFFWNALYNCSDGRSPAKETECGRCGHAEFTHLLCVLVLKLLYFYLYKLLRWWTFSKIWRSPVSLLCATRVEWPIYVYFLQSVNKVTLIASITAGPEVLGLSLGIVEFQFHSIFSNVFFSKAYFFYWRLFSDLEIYFQNAYE